MDHQLPRMTRRSALKTLGGTVAAGLLPASVELNAQERAEVPAGEVKPIWLPKFWEDSETRPAYVWENREDVIYHDLEYPVGQVPVGPSSHLTATANAAEFVNLPEFRPFMHRVWVFNRAMQWHDKGLDGCLLCYSDPAGLALTGEHQVSAWHTGEKNSLTHSGASTTFEKKSGRRRDAAVLPAFQFHLGQNPKVELAVSEATSDWQFCISIKGRSGPPFISTGWQSGPRKLSFDVANELRQRGHTLNFAELHFVMGTWTKESSAPSAVTFEVTLPGHAAVVTCLPVIRSLATAQSQGVPVIAVALDERSQRLGNGRVKLSARVQEQIVPMEESGGFWKAKLHDLKLGEHQVTITSEGDVNGTTTIPVRVTDGAYFTFDKERRTMRYRDEPTGPLTGSYQGMFPFRDVGLPSERIVNEQAEWDAWDRTQAPGEHMHGWEALTETELDSRFAYLQRSGWDVLHLHQHWGCWERLDGGGRIAPYGAEQVALYMRVAARHGLVHNQALSSYEYAADRNLKLIGGTPPWSSYVEAGFKDEDWLKPGDTAFNRMFHEYLRDFVLLFKEETALFAMTTSGEGDQENGPARTNDGFRFVRSLDPNHAYLSEPILFLSKLPRELTAAFEEDTFGGRTYGIGSEIFPEYDMAVEFKFFQMGRNYKAEGEWPSSNMYTRFHYDALRDEPAARESWLGTLRYRNRVRDALYLGFVHRLPLIVSWDEQMTGDEHIILRQVRELVNWKQEFATPKVAVRVDDANTHGNGRANLAEFEKAFARLPLAYYLIEPNAQAPEGTVVFDARQPYQQPRFTRFRDEIPLRISEGYCASYTCSQDRQTLLAYVYNVTHHTDQPQWISGRYHRIPKPAALKVALQNLTPGALKYRLFDLNEKKLVRKDTLNERTSVDLGSTDHDYFVLVTPA